jgi:3,4-dehydroadipyl-CoA semialdehyde dehydrogenase
MAVEPVRIRSFVKDQWVDGRGDGATLLNPATEEVVATASATGVDFGAALAHARKVGGASLRGSTFTGRAQLLKRLGGLIREHRDELLELSTRNGGNTKSDAKFDVDGASGALLYYANLGSKLGDGPALAAGDGVPLGKETPLYGQHLWLPLHGAAVLINAYNFPAWGFAEKVACAVLAGMPVVVKPATQTALLAYRIAEIFVEKGGIPPGVWTFLAGPPGDLLDHLEAQDVLAFTGAASTAASLRSHRTVLNKGVRINIEADSLNAVVLGPDVAPGSVTWDLCLRDVAQEMIQKAGQKCTATRRIAVPLAQLAAFRDQLVGILESVKVGDPAHSEMTMGPLVSSHQRDSVRAGLAELEREARVVTGGSGQAQRHDGGDPGVGFFFSPTLLEAGEGGGVAVHHREVFGPVATLLPYTGQAQEAATLVGKGEGSLVSSLYSDDSAFVRELILGAASFNGRVTIGSAVTASESWGPGAVLPALNHGGPGRAGGGEELGGLPGVYRYMQRTALQGPRAFIEAVFAGSTVDPASST